MKSVAAGVVVLVCVTGCHESDSGHVAPSTDRGAADLFEVDHVPLFEFTLPDSDWQSLQEHAVNEQYTRAEAVFEGQPAGTVGLRFKGNYGSLYSCFDRNTGVLICAKLSFKVNFSKYDNDNRFFGLKSLNLHSMIKDPTKLHERLAYELYQLSDIKTPRSTWANVKVNGQSYGLFSLVEEIDGRFTADRWPDDGEGNLYKEAWPESTDSTYYADKLETNENKANHEQIVAFAKDLTQSSADGLSQALGNWMDLASLYRYMAVDDAIMNCDGVTAFYCASGTGPVFGNHNYFFYQQQKRDSFWLVPWDMTRPLTPCPAFAAVPHWNTQPADCDQNYAVWDGGWVKAPGCDRVFQALSQDWQSYQAAVDKLLAGPFDAAALLQKIDAWSSFIRDSVIADPTADGDVSWHAAVEELKNTVPILRDRLTKIRDGEAITTLALSLRSTNDFESASPVEAKLGLQLDASAHTYVTQQLNTTQGLNGHQDLRLDFVYRDPTQAAGEGWQQWIHFMLPFDGGFHDLTSVGHIQMLILADQPRTVRIELESDRYQAAGKRIRFGWEVPVSNSISAVDLVLDEATLPSWGTGTTDELSDVRQHVNGLAFSPSVVGMDASGYLGSGKSDPGHLEIDDIAFVSP
jgi:spore coat protein H